MGDAVKNPKGLEAAVAELGAISGQRPVVTRAKKSIANFNLRQGMAVGCSVTLRGARMYEFLDRFITIALPRMRTSGACRRIASTAGATIPSESRSR